MSEPRDPLEERLDRLFATTRPRRGFEDELWARLEVRRGLWARLTDRLRSVQLVPVLGGLAALVVVVLAGGLLLNSVAHGSRASTSSYSGGTRGGAAGAQSADSSAGFGRVPRPVVRLSDAPQPAVTLPAAPKAAYAGSVTVTAVTASAPLPARLPVTRYRELTAPQADAFAAGLGARPSGPVPPGALGRYAGANFTLTIYPSDPGQGIEPRVVITPGSPAPQAAGPDDVKAYLGRFAVAPDATATAPVTDRAGGQEVVRWTRLVSAGVSELNASWEATVGSDLSILVADGALPLAREVADYAVASSQQLVALAKAAGGGSGPAVVLDTAQAVYVVASDGAYGYFEPAVLYTGHFTQGGVTYEKRILVPAVAPQDLR